MTRAILMSAVRIALACLAAQPAVALSCLPPDAVTLYERARDAEERFLILRGKVETEARLSLPRDGKPAETPVRVTGAVLTDEGFAPGFERDALLRLTCAGPWCGGAPGGDEVFMALEVTGGGLVVEIGPCLANAVPADDAGAARIEACHRGEACETAPLP